MKKGEVRLRRTQQQLEKNMREVTNKYGKEDIFINLFSLDYIWIYSAPHEVLTSQQTT